MFMHDWTTEQETSFGLFVMKRSSVFAPRVAVATT